MGLLTLLLALCAASRLACAAASFTCAPQNDRTTCTVLEDMYAATNGATWLNASRVAPAGWSGAASGEDARHCTSSTSRRRPARAPRRLTARAGAATDYCNFDGVTCCSSPGVECPSGWPTAAVVSLCVGQPRGCSFRPHAAAGLCVRPT